MVIFKGFFGGTARKSEKKSGQEKPPAPQGQTDNSSASDARTQAERAAERAAERQAATARTADKAKEVGGPKGLEPTRYGDWEKAGRCIDF